MYAVRTRSGLQIPARLSSATVRCLATAAPPPATPADPSSSSSSQPTKTVGRTNGRTRGDLRKRVLPQLSRVRNFPDITAPDPLLDSKVVDHTPASRKHPYNSTVIQYRPYDNSTVEKPTGYETFSDIKALFEKLQDSEDTSDSSPSERRRENEEDDVPNANGVSPKMIADSRSPYPESLVRKLHQYPLVQKRVVNQTPKGRQASQYVLLAVGNGNGVVGIGEGKDAEDGRLAKERALKDALKNLDVVSRFENRTIWTATSTKLGATKIDMWPRPAGFGLAVNPYLHRICKAAGIRDLAAKVHGSRNGMQVAKAAIRILHGGATPQGFGDGVGGKGRRLEAKEGIRSKHVVERERGRKMIEGSSWL